MIEKEILVKLIGEGKTIWQIADELKYSRKTIEKYITIHNIQIPSKGFYSHPDRKTGRPIGHKWNEKQREYFSKLFKGEGNPFFGKKHSEETRKKMSENHADFTGDKNPFKNSIEKDENKRRGHEKRCKDIWDNRSDEYKKKLGENASKGRYMDISGYFFSRTRHNALNRGFDFDITIHQMWDLFLKQSKRCALSGIDLTLAMDINKVTASLDRIDGREGYSIDNVQWVHKDINIMRNTLTVTEFVDYCRKVAEYDTSKVSKTQVDTPA